MADPSLPPARQNHHYTHDLSRFEHIFTTCPPILEVLLLHLPTCSIFDLYHTSRHLRDFFRAYPLAFKNLSFRLLLAPPAQPSAAGTESPDLIEPKRPYALDLLLRFGVPSTACLARLDLDNTSVSGTELHASVLSPGRSTLQHLSVRGCKDVSIKYHILPFLQMQMSTPPELFAGRPFSLKSLYTYRCRHHRRRPYLPQSLNRKDSDSQPTHQLIELCHRLGIWTDTAWCPSPGSRCHRRKEYFVGRGTMGADEVWVPFDRLWRSHNVVGSVREFDDSQYPLDHGIGRLWEDREQGYGGEALGSAMDGWSEGKEVPTHLRASHTVFVKGYKCHHCGDQVLERCEQCSIRMHCMGCRKTLCHSCAFDRPVRRHGRRNQQAQAQGIGAALTSALGSSSGVSLFTPPRRKARNEQHRRKDPFWWAPGATRSPNLMREAPAEDGSSSDDDDTVAAQGNGPPQEPRLQMHWCCLKPSFSGGGGLQFVGTPCGDNVRASPLPQGMGFEDPDFVGVDTLTHRHPAHDHVPLPNDDALHSDEASSGGSLESADSDVESEGTSVVYPRNDPSNFDILPFLESPVDPNHLAHQKYSSPRSLCKSCYESTRWKIPCAGCGWPICIEHDLKRLKARRCGFRRLSRERDNIQQAHTYLSQGQTVPRHVADAGVMTFLAKWRPIVAHMTLHDEERRAQGKWTPHEAASRYSERADDHAADHAALSVKESLILPDLGDIVSSHAETKFDIAEHLARLDETKSLLPRIFLSRTRSASAVPQTKPPFPPSHTPRGSSDSAKMSVAFMLNPAHPLRGGNDSSAPEDAETILPRALAPTSMPPWTGCGAYLCANPRLPGDPRPSCGVRDAALYCTNCSVLVCTSCLEQQPACTCKACATAFHCPNCRDDPRVRALCLRTQDDATHRAATPSTADEVADEFHGLNLDGVSDFWAGLEAELVGDGTLGSIAEMDA